MPNTNTKGVYRSTGSLKAQGGSYKALDHKMIEGQETAPMMDYLI